MCFPIRSVIAGGVLAATLLAAAAAPAQAQLQDQTRVAPTNDLPNRHSQVEGQATIHRHPALSPSDPGGQLNDAHSQVAGRSPNLMHKMPYQRPRPIPTSWGSVDRNFLNLTVSNVCSGNDGGTRGGTGLFGKRRASRWLA